MESLLLCTDLDRTLLPNGNASESPGARELFARVSARPEVTLTYVTGRHLEWVEAAIEEYALPLPRFAICDVGGSIYERAGEGRESGGSSWRLSKDWEGRLSTAWEDETVSAARQALQGVAVLSMQEAERQSAFKLSYYAPELADPRTLLDEVTKSLIRGGLSADTFYSVDETEGVGLLDLLPPGSGKKGAIDHLLAGGEFARDRTLFAGDSGNDMQVLASSVPSVLVANATERVRIRALALAAEAGHADRLHLARGNSLGMNGNYGAGILEGMIHYWPETQVWLG